MSDTLVLEGYEAALSHLRQAVSLASEMADYPEWFGGCLKRMGRYREARVGIVEALPVLACRGRRGCRAA